MATHPDCLLQLADELTEKLGDEHWVCHQEKGTERSLPRNSRPSSRSPSTTKPSARFLSATFGASQRLAPAWDWIPCVALSAPVRSPFGVVLTEIIIPRHLAPKEGGEETAEVPEREAGVVHLRLRDKAYCYSQLGLERQDGAERPTN